MIYMIVKLDFCHRSIQVKCLDIHSMCALSYKQVGVACGRPDVVSAYDIDDETSPLKLEGTVSDSNIFFSISGPITG